MKDGAKQTKPAAERPHKTRLSPRCQSRACGEVAFYGNAFDKSRVYCRKHALCWHTHNYMRPWSCEARGCMRVPEFGYPKVRKLVLCGSHAAAAEKPVEKLPGARKPRPLFCSDPWCLEWPMLYKHVVTMETELFCPRHASSEYVLYPKLF